MSLGVFWSLLNPLVMMGVLTFIFTKVFPSPGTPKFPAFVMCGLVPFNFFSIAWATGAGSIFANSNLIKRVTFPREIVPISTVLANGVHFLIQIALVIVLVLASGYGVNRYWLILPVIFGLELVFVCGLSLASSALDVYFRDIRYVVESTNTVLFWLVPIFYPFSIIPAEYHSVYQYNPIAAVVLACRNILLDGQAPPASLLLKLSAVSVSSLVAGFVIFRLLKRKFADYL